MVELASDSKAQYEEVLRAAETLSVVLGVQIHAALRSEGIDHPALTALAEAYVLRGVTQGHWLAVLRAGQHLSRHVTPIFPGAEAALLSGKKGSGLLQDLEMIVRERNLWAHGAGPRSPSDARSRLDIVLPALSDALDRAAFLSASPWLFTRSSSYRRTSGDFLVQGLDAMGDHPDFERRELISTVPLADSAFYAMGTAGPVDLSPFVVMHDCPECRQEELCYADRLDPKMGVSLKSFARGHAMFEPDLNRELERVLAAR